MDTGPIIRLLPVLAFEEAHENFLAARIPRSREHTIPPEGEAVGGTLADRKRPSENPK